jgi:hypothetical protein
MSSAAALDFVSNMNEKRESTSPTAIQVTNWRKAICVKEEKHVRSRLEK